jgi:anti-sigma regulatory factor (Ser/Thr protein kinase)
MSTTSEPSPTIEEPAAHTAGAAIVWCGTVTDGSQLSDARRDAAAALRGAGCGEESIDNVVLALSELAVNALTHGAATSVEITVSMDGASSAVLVTRHVDRGTPALTDPPTMATIHELQGRGRAIVASIADRFDTYQRPGNQIEHVARFVG